MIAQPGATTVKDDVTGIEFASRIPGHGQLLDLVGIGTRSVTWLNIAVFVSCRV